MLGLSACFRLRIGSDDPALADHVIALALRRRHGDVALAPIDDRAELRAHAAALRLRA